MKLEEGLKQDMQLFIKNEYSVPDFDLKTRLFDDLQIKVLADFLQIKSYKTRILISNFWKAQMLWSK